MAEIHTTTWVPGKLDLLGRWLPLQPRYVQGAAQPALTRVGGLRLDDPAGEVGIELMFVRDEAGPDPVTYHVPMTYRGEPLSSAGPADPGLTTLVSAGWTAVDGSEHRGPVIVAEWGD